MNTTPWTPSSIRDAIEVHRLVAYANEDRAGEIEEEIKSLKAELADCEAVAERHRKAQHRLVGVARGKAA